MAEERDDFDVNNIASTLQSAVEKLSANIEKSIISASMASAKIITDSINSGLTGLKSNIDTLSSVIQENPKVNPSSREGVTTDRSDPFSMEYDVEADVKVSMGKLEKEVELKIKSDPEKKSLAKEYSKKEEQLKEAQASTRQFISDQSNATRGLKQFGNPLVAAILGGINNWEINNKKIALASQALDAAQAELKIYEVRTNLLNEGIQSEINATQNKIDQISTELKSIVELATRTDDEIIAKTNSIRGYESENQMIQEKMQVNNALIQGLQAGIDLAKQDYDASKDNIILLEQKKAAESSQISAINEQIRELEVRGEFKGQGMTDAQRSEIAKSNAEKVQALQLEKEGLLASFNETKASIQAEKSRRNGIESELGAMQSELDSSVAAQNEYEEILKHNSESLNAARSELDALISEKDQYGQMINSSKTAIDNLTEKIELLESEIEKNNKSLQAKREAVDKARRELENAKTKKYADAIGDVRKVLTILVKYLNAVVKEVRDLQKQLGITAGSAAKIKFEVLMQSISSYVKALAGATPVSRKEIETAISDFRSEFGGLISTKEATELAKEAKAMGLTTQQLAAARRVFMTQTMGDLSSAQREQDRFIKVFTQQGMTSKDAMEFIGKNSELLARSGTRFQQSMARAAAEAKKIGVDLSKVNQVGDNIIGNFEGFLESMAELGAMGFGFDATRLAEVAERGDTSALFDELRSQLRVTGRDLTDLTRSQQLSLSSAFGMGIEDFQRLAGLTPDIGEAETETETGLLSKLVNILEGVAGTLGLINTLLSGLHTVLLTQIAINTGGLLGLKRLFGRGGTFGRAGGRGRGARLGTRGRVIGRRMGVVGRGGKISTSPMARNISRVASKSLPAIGTGLAVLGAGIEFSQISKAQKSGQISDQEARKQRAGTTGSLGTGLAGGYAGAKVGAAIGAVGGPIGIAAGGIIGGTLGYLAGSSVGRTVGEAVGEAFNKVSSMFQSAVDGIGNRLSKWKDAISGASESIKNLIGGMVKSLVNGIKNIVTAPFKLAKKAGGKVGSLLGMGTRSIGSDLDIGGSGDIESGDDVISKPGYGKRSLVTPQKTIALNNDDNIVAYADDMISTNTGVELLSKGALVDKADKSSPEIKVDVDLGKLERKLDQVVSAITSMKVEMDAQKVGRIVADSEQKSSTMGIFQTQRIS